MSFKHLFKVLETMHPVSPELQRALMKEMTTLSYPKNYILHEAPWVADYAYFVHSGYAISYFFLKGRKRVQCIWNSGQIMFLPTSFIEKSESKEHIELIDDCELICINHTSVIRLFKDFPETNSIYRKVMNQYYDSTRERLIDTLFLSAPERLRKLLDRLPEVEQIMNQEDVASFLGITPQSLSRIKRKS